MLTCTPHVSEEANDKLYFFRSCSDTLFLNSFSFDTTDLVVIAEKVFENSNENFRGVVKKLEKLAPPVDGGVVYYLTSDLGIIFSKSTTWHCYSRLHSTNAEIENRINQYLEHILISPELVLAGDVPPGEGNIKFTPPEIR